MHVLSRLRQPEAHRLLRWADSSGKHLKRPMKYLHLLVRFLLITYKEFSKNSLPLRSAALTYTILLSLVPILAMSTAVVKGLGGDNQLREVAYRYIDSLDENASMLSMLGKSSAEPVSAPESSAVMTTDEQGPSGLTGHLREAVDMIFDYVDKINFSTLGSFGVIGILISVILVFGNIEIALNTIWNITTNRSITRKIADYLTLIILFPLSISVAIGASAFLANPELSSKFQLLIPFAWMQTLILKLLPVFFITLTFYVVFLFFPNTKVHTTPALAGAFLAASLWFAVQNIYISLQVGVSNYNAIYGSFATLPLFLVWMYLGWLFVLCGAQVAYVFQNMRSYRLLDAPAGPAKRLSAAFDIMDSVQKSFANNQPITVEDLISLQPNYSSTLLQNITAELVEAELLYISEKHERLLPAGPANSSNHSAIIEVIFGNATPDTPGGKASEQAIDAAKVQPAQSLCGSFADIPGQGSGNRQEGPSST